MNVWATKDPVTGRISLLDHEPDEASFPPGPRGVGWPVRHTEVDDTQFAACLAGTLTGQEADTLHQQAWEKGT